MTFLYTEQWYTIAVTPLSVGWFNVFGYSQESDGERCPALLLQELRTTVKYDQELRKTVETKRHTAPLDTRVVFGAFGEENGTITPAMDVANYQHTEYRGDA